MSTSWKASRFACPCPGVFSYGVLFCGLVSSLAMPAALAQSTFATVQGTVLDSSGAAVPGASVTILDEGTGTRKTLQAGSAGEYRAFDLDAGTYSITFASPGFGDQTFPHQTVLARQVIRLDASLKAGSVNEQVEVTAGSNAFSDVATVSHSLSSADNDTLALNFRASDQTSPLSMTAHTSSTRIAR